MEEVSSRETFPGGISRKTRQLIAYIPMDTVN